VSGTLARAAPRPATLLLAAVIAQACVSVTEQGVPMLTGFVKQDLSLSAAVAGLLVSSLFAGKVAGSYVVGALVDHVGERRMLAASAVCAGLFVLAASVAPLGAMIVLLAGAGVCTAAATPAGGRLILLAFPRSRRGVGMGIRQTGVPLGGLAAALLLPVVAGASWRAGLATVGALTLAGGVAAIALVGVELRGPARGAPPLSVRDLAELARDRDLRLATAWGALLVSGQYAILAFLALDVHEHASISLTSAVAFAGVAHAGGMVGRLAWGWLSDRAFGGRRRPLLGVITAAAVVVALALAALPGGASVAVIAVIAFLAGLSILGWQGVWVTLVCELAGADRAGAATGFALTFIALASLVAAPLYGLVVDLTGSYRTMWLALATALAASSLPLLLARERPEPDDLPLILEGAPT
jgi:sugar phosphate permease